VMFTRQCTAGATVEALDDTRCQRIRANRVRRAVLLLQGQSSTAGE
jgi:hypothetical protein